MARPEASREVLPDYRSLSEYPYLLRGVRPVSWRPAILLGMIVGALIAVVFVGATPQDIAYHNFVDKRKLLGVPNFLNVMSNLPFLIVGLFGWRTLCTYPHIVSIETAMAWRLFFAGVVLTTLGSGYFHWQPDNASLIWDRIPMTIAFMSLVSIVVAEYFSPSVGRKLLLPLLLTGVASVLYWAWTESRGVGDLRPYALVQFIPMLLIPMVILLYRSRSDLGLALWWMIGFYVLAKLFEHFDFNLYQYGNVISGHSVKHLIAALAPLSLVLGLQRRRAR